MNATPGTANQRRTVTCQDAGDGSGDLIVRLPAELKSDMGLAVGDTLSIIKVWIQPVDATDWLNRSAGVS